MAERGFGRRAAELKRRARYLRDHGRAFWTEARRKEPGVPRAVHAGDIFAGFDPLERSWYRQARGNSNGCTSNYDRKTRLSGLNGPNGYLLGNKLGFAHTMRSLALPHPELSASP